jgi:acyl-CoA reductase-like NAD-dependent aldehyde dehydrogenase
VHESIYEEFVEGFVGRTKAIRVGDPLNVQTEMGPVISLEQKKKVLNYIEEGVRSHARLLCGGEPSDISLQAGYYLLPSVFADVENKSTIAQEEIFGPVVCVLKFSDEAEAIRLANDTIFGLAASIWTNDLSRAHRVAKALRAGVVSVNSVAVTYVEAPFGGYKQSGIGRELGLEGLLLFSETKSVYMRI